VLLRNRWHGLKNVAPGPSFGCGQRPRCAQPIGWNTALFGAALIAAIRRAQAQLDRQLADWRGWTVRRLTLAGIDPVRR